MIDIEVRGFQSIEHATLKVEGFTALVGRSNIGKSAIVRAVKAALTNALGTSFVRHGAACLRRTKGTKTCKCETMVHIVAPGFDLRWRKGDAVNEYVFNGVTKTVPGRGFPDFLSPAFAPVKLGEDQKLLQIADQFFPIFLLDQSGATVANILSDVARLDAVNVAMKYVERDRKEANALRKVREKDVESLKASLAAYDGLDNVLDKTVAIAEGYDRLADVEKTLDAASQLCSRLTLLVSDIKALDGVDKIVTPDASRLRDRGATHRHAVSLHDRLVELVAAYKAIEGSARIEVPDPKGLHVALDRVRVASTLAKSHAECEQVVLALDGVEVITPPDPAPLVRQVRQHAIVGDLHRRLIAHVEAVRSLDGVDGVDTPSPSHLAERGREGSRIEGWVGRLREFRAWFDERKDLDHLAAPDTQPLGQRFGDLVRVSDLTRRSEALHETIAVLERQYAETAAGQQAAEDALNEFVSTAREKGWICGECSQPIRGRHTHLDEAR